MAGRRWQRRYYRRAHRIDPYRRVKGRYCGIGLGSFVHCRRRLPVSRRRAKVGLHIPVPGKSSRAVRPPDNTVQILKNNRTGDRVNAESARSPVACKCFSLARETLVGSYAARCPDIQLVAEYVDDGYTGTNFVEVR